MVRASLFLFGYRRLLIDPSDMPSVCAALMHRGVALQQVSKEELLIAERAVSHIEAVCDGKIEYSLSEPMGIFGIIKRTKYKRGIIAGIIISLLLTVFLQNLVWDIRIDGAVKKSEQEIKDLLASCGLEIGSSWHSLDRAFVEAEVLASKSGISWININRRGTIAYVEIKENEGNYNESDDKDREGWANLVAGESCVIEEITVTRGVAAVKAGDVVKKGDVLISGIAADGSFCYAEGLVLGRVSRRVEASVSRNYDKVISSEEHIKRTDIKIFNFLINIFKNYGNSYSDCDIIEDVKVFSVFNTPLPLAIKTTSAIVQVTEKAEYSDEELVLIASEELSERTKEVLEKSDVLKIRTFGEFSNERYSMYSDIVMLTSVGEALEFYIE